MQRWAHAGYELLPADDVAAQMYMQDAYHSKDD